MRCVVFVPGIMGSILSTPAGEEVWPPTPLEAVTSYKRTDKLVRDDLKVGGIIRKVSCFPFYEPLIETFEDMGFKEKGRGDRLVLFPYDWRLDLEDLADELAATMATVPVAAKAITLVAHSMGGLVSRLTLESGKFKDADWLKKIDTFYTLATPHLGAPLALGRILGLDSEMGISAADFRKLASDTRYPSGYQLLPAPGEDACWDVRIGKDLDAFDIYDPKVARDLGLNPDLVARAAWVHKTLAKGKAPEHIRYFYFAATGHKTPTRVNVSSEVSQITRSEDAGDGTVPLWSALPKSGQKQLVVGSHTDFFSASAFKAVFYRLFGKDYPLPPLAATAEGAVSLSVQAVGIAKTDAIDLLIAPAPNAGPIERIAAEVVIERTDGPPDKFLPFGKPVKITYAGPPLPMLKVRLPPTKKAGFYRITLKGTPAASKPAQFAVAEN